MKKILFVATVPEHFRYFHLPCFKMLSENGCEVHTVCSSDEKFPFTEKNFNVHIGRSPADPQNIKAISTLKKIIEEEKYDAVHCHTPMGGAVARIASRKMRKKGMRVIYTAHGFHFYKGAPLMNWLIFYTMEYLMSFMTDDLITINTEDFERGKKLLKAKRTHHVHGVGCDTSRFGKAENTAQVREKLGFSPDEKIIAYVAEQNENKNQQLLVRAVSGLSQKIKNIRLLIVGPDNIGGKYEELAKELSAPVSFLGRRDDVPEILSVCDIYAASSLREGLPVNVMEAMASSLPVVAVNNRGHRALVENGVTGYIVNPDEKEMADRLCEILNSEELYEKMAENALRNISDYDVKTVISELYKIYFN